MARRNGPTARLFWQRQRLRREWELLRLEFPKTEMQVYGNTVIIYTTYLYELEVGGKRTVTTGRATEMFVLRGNDLVNVGWHLDNGQ